jgi:hypothetical protein
MKKGVMDERGALEKESREVRGEKSIMEGGV